MNKQLSISNLAKFCKVSWKTARRLLVLEADQDGRVLQWTPFGEACKAQQHPITGKITFDERAFVKAIAKRSNNDGGKQYA